MRRRRRAVAMAEADIEILPLMNLFVVLIPMLLLSAVFLEMAVIRMNLPTDDEVSSAPKETLGLSVAISDARYVVASEKTKRVTIDRGETQADDELRAALESVKERFPSNEQVVIRSQARTKYEDIVAVMDISRESGMPSVGLAGNQ